MPQRLLPICAACTMLFAALISFGSLNAGDKKLAQAALKFMPEKTMAMLSFQSNPLLDEGVLGFEKTAGFSPRQLARCTLFLSAIDASSPDESDYFIVMQTKTPIVNKAMFQNLEIVKQDAELADLFHLKGARVAMAMRPVDAQTYVMGRTEVIKAVNKSAAKMPMTPFAQRILKMDLSQSLTLICDTQQLPKELLPQPLSMAKSLELSMNADEFTTANLTIDFKQADQAQMAKQTLEGMLASAQKEMPPFAQDVLKSKKMAVTGSAFKLAMRIKTSHLLQSLRSAQNKAKRVQSMAQLRNLMNTCFLYAVDNQGKFPKSLGELLADDYMPGAFIQSPYAKNIDPKDISKFSKAQKVAWLNKHSAYCYITGLTTAVDHNQVVLFEKIIPQGAKELNLAFGDGHVESMPIKKASELIKKQTGKSWAQWVKLANPGAGN